MRLIPSLKGKISPWVYALAAPALILSQHLAVMITFRTAGWPLAYDTEFWLLPMRRLALLPDISLPISAIAFAFSLFVAWGLAVLSFRRASRSWGGYALAALAVVPVLQIPAIAALALFPVETVDDEPDPTGGANVHHILQGLFAGMAVIVFAVLVSAVAFRAYGWGLFVLTPFVVGITTAYIANRNGPLEPGRTTPLVIAAAALGCVGLIVFALEGLICILMAAPLGLVVAMVGGAIGRVVALTGHRRGKPFLSIALLPAVFAFDAALPPAVPLLTHETIEIAASPSKVWQAVISDEPIASRPTLSGRLGLAYPLASRIDRQGLGASRVGQFSTGIAQEKVIAWVPESRLGFMVMSQPPAMEELSPHGKVHAPHLNGYFETGETQFDLTPLPGGGTRLTVRAAHVLRLDPVLYWEPLARWAVGDNARRVLGDIKRKAETPS